MTLNIQRRQLLEAAAIGYRSFIEQYQQKVKEIEQELSAPVTLDEVLRKSPIIERRTMSPAARRRIAAAQRKRWAAYRKTHKKAA